MLNAAFVVLRELAELLLISLAVLAWANRAQRHDLKKVVPIATLLGVACGCLLAAWLKGDAMDPRLEAACAVLLGGATLWMALNVLFSSHSVHEHVQAMAQSLPAGRGCVAMLSAFCLFAGLRESMEVWMFLDQAADHHPVADLALGAAMGAAVLLLGLVALRPMVLRVRWLTLYRLSTVGLCFVSVQLLLGGMADLLTLSMAHPATDMALVRTQAADAMRASATAWVATLIPTAVFLKRWWCESSTA